MQQFSVARFASAYANGHSEESARTVNDFLPFPLEIGEAQERQTPEQTQEEEEMARLFQERMAMKRLKAMADRQSNKQDG